MIKENDTSEEKTTKYIVKNLEHLILLGDEEKIMTQIFAVEKNTKNHYKKANITEGDVKYEPLSKKIHHLNITAGCAGRDEMLGSHLNFSIRMMIEQLKDDEENMRASLIDGHQKEIKYLLLKQKENQKEISKLNALKAASKNN